MKKAEVRKYFMEGRHQVWYGYILSVKERVTSSEEETVMEILVVGVSNLCVLGCALDTWDLVGGH